MRVLCVTNNQAKSNYDLDRETVGLAPRSPVSYFPPFFFDDFRPPSRETGLGIRPTLVLDFSAPLRSSRTNKHHPLLLSTDKSLIFFVFKLRLLCVYFPSRCLRERLCENSQSFPLACAR